MKIRILYPQGKENKLIAELQSEYILKMSRVVEVKLETVKSKSSDRDSAHDKKKNESNKLLEQVTGKDFVVILDEKGKSHKSSIEFAADLRKIIENNNSKITFIIGGPYGFSDEIYARANLKWQLSNLTMNHHIARLVLLEQLYRSYTIWQNLPYHNV
jgi:23S rRNA (pseudouridine1915-N3)-methyltransferase